MNRQDAYMVISSDEYRVYKILSYLENNTSLDNLIYSNSEKELYFNLFFALLDLNFINLVLSKGNTSMLEKRLTDEGRRYLAKIRNKFEHN